MESLRYPHGENDERKREELHRQEVIIENIAMEIFPGISKEEATEELANAGLLKEISNIFKLNPGISEERLREIILPRQKDNKAA